MKNLWAAHMAYGYSYVCLLIVATLDYHCSDDV